MPLDYTLQIDNDKVRIACNKMNAQATSGPFPLPMLTEILPAAMDQRSMHPRTLDDYSIRFTNTHVRLVKASQVVAEFPIIFAPTLISMARETEGDLFAS